MKGGDSRLRRTNDPIKHCQRGIGKLKDAEDDGVKIYGSKTVYRPTTMYNSFAQNAIDPIDRRHINTNPHSIHKSLLLPLSKKYSLFCHESQIHLCETFRFIISKSDKFVMVTGLSSVVCKSPVSELS